MQRPGTQGRLGATVDVELGIDALGVRLDGSLRDDQMSGDLPIRVSISHLAQHFQLAQAQQGSWQRFHDPSG